MKRVLKQNGKFKRTIAFCVIIAILATLLHMNGARADDKQEVEADPVWATVQLGEKTEAGTPVTITFNEKEGDFDTTKSWVQDWQNAGWIINGNQLTKTMPNNQHTELVIYYYDIDETDSLITYYPEVAKVAIPYELDKSSTTLIGPGTACTDYEIDDEEIVTFEVRDGNKYFKPVSVGRTTLRGKLDGYDFEWPIIVTDSGNTDTPADPTETTVFADVQVGDKTSAGYPVTVTFNSVNSFDTGASFVQSWINNGWNVNGNKATRTFAVDGETSIHQSYLSCKTQKNQNGEQIIINEVAKIAIPYDLDMASNRFPGISSSVSNATIANTNIAAINTDNNGSYIKPVGVGSTTMTGTYKGYEYSWPINVVNSSNPGDNPGTNPGDNPGTNPGDNPGTNPGDDPGTNPGDNPGTNPGDNPGTNPGDNPGTNPGDNPGTNPGDNPGTNPGDNPETNPGANPGINTGDNGNSNQSSKNNGTEITTTETDKAKVKEDYTVATKKLSKTGENNLYVFVMIGLVLIAIRAYIKDLKERRK